MHWRFEGASVPTGRDESKDGNSRKKAQISQKLRNGRAKTRLRKAYVAANLKA
jgi:hypothetical protein